MSSNDVVLVQDMLTEHRRRVGNTLSDSEVDTYFAIESYLRHETLSRPELLEGVVDGSHDAGLDGAYLFINGIYIRDDTPISALGKRAQIELILFQIKNTAGFGESAIDRLLINLPPLLQFDRDELSLEKKTNSRVLEVTRRFLEAYRAIEMPTLKIRVVFVSLRAVDIHENTLLKGKLLGETLKACFSGSECEVSFLGARDICDIRRQEPQALRSLQLAENPISTDTSGGYIGVVRLRDYQEFVTTRSGELDTALFEANVRDYEGETGVNESIQQTLVTNDSAVDFWWLNNGVTIVARRIQLANKLLELDSPQIVNGLQTSTEIYKTRASMGSTDGRSVLVKVVEAREPEVRERIIRATNSQTAFGPSALKATDRVQRQIEEYLAPRGLWYERRRLQYHNLHKPEQDIVSIDEMGQALLSVCVQTPHIARGRVTRIFDNDVYKLLFHPSFPLPAYLASIRLLRSCTDYVRDLRGYTSSTDDFRFHLASGAAIVLTRKDKPSVVDMAKIVDVAPSRQLLDSMFELIQQEYGRTTRTTAILTLDQLAKDGATAESIIQAFRRHMRSTPRES